MNSLRQWRADLDSTRQNFLGAGQRRFHTHIIVHDGRLLETERRRLMGLQHNGFANRAYPVAKFSLTSKVLGFQVRNLYLRFLFPQVDPSAPNGRLECGHAFFE